MKRWYVLYSKPNAEYRVRNFLESRGIDVYLPLVITGDNQPETPRVPLFPCYLFMREDLDVVAGSAWRWTPGLRRIVSFEGQPLPLPDSAVEEIRRRLREINGSGGLPKHPFKQGEVVRIKEGPFADIKAIFEGPTTSSERVRVLLYLLGRVNQVTLDVSLLEKAPRNALATEPPRPRRTRGRGRTIRYERSTMR